MAGDFDSPLPWANTGTGRHGRNGSLGNVEANRCKITVGHFQNLRAMVAAFTPALPILS